MSRPAFILETVGREVTLACSYSGDLAPSDWFQQLVPLLEDTRPTRQVEIRWWKDGKIKTMARYELSHPDGQVLAGPGAPTGDYLPDGELPPGPGYELQVALFTFDDGADRLATPGDPMSRETRWALDAAAGVSLFPQHSELRHV